MNQVIISDTSPLIVLLHADCLKYLKDIYKNKEIFITQVVFDEIAKVPSEVEELKKYDFIKTEKLKENDEKEIDKINKDTKNKLDAGEVTSIAICKRFDNPLLIIDDFDAVKYATKQNIETESVYKILEKIIKYTSPEEYLKKISKIRYIHINEMQYKSYCKIAQKKELNLKKIDKNKEITL